MKKLAVAISTLGLMSCGGGGGGSASALSTAAPLTLTAQDKTGKEGTPLLVNLVGSDTKGLSLQYRCVSGCPAGMSIDTLTGVISWTPNYGDAGIYNLVLEVSNGTLKVNANAKITIAVGNLPPVFAAMQSQTVAEGQTIVLRPQATDPDGDAVTITSIGTMPIGGSFSSGTVSFSPGYNQSGSYTFYFRASDGKATTDTSVTVSVSNTNRAPVMSIGPKSIAEGSNLSFAVNAVDPDGDVVSYSSSNLPSGASLNSSTGVFSWTPDCYSAGTANVSISATDGNLTATEIVPITVSNTNCYAPHVGWVGTTDTGDFTFTSSMPTQTHMHVNNVMAYDLDTGSLAQIGASVPYNTGVTIGYGRVEVKCFASNQNYNVSITGTAVDVTRASGVIEEEHSFLMYAEDAGGLRTYFWMKTHFTTTTYDPYYISTKIRPMTNQTWSVSGNEGWLCTSGSPVVVNH